MIVPIEEAKPRTVLPYGAVTRYEVVLYDGVHRVAVLAYTARRTKRALLVTAQLAGPVILKLLGPDYPEDAEWEYKPDLGVVFSWTHGRSAVRVAFTGRTERDAANNSSR